MACLLTFYSLLQKAPQANHTLDLPFRVPHTNRTQVLPSLSRNVGNSAKVMRLSHPLTFFVPILLLAMAMPRFIIHFLEFLPLRVFQPGGVRYTHPDGTSNPSKGRLSLFFLAIPRDRCLTSNLVPPQSLKFNAIKSHDLKGNHSKSADIQLYTVTQSAFPNRETHTNTTRSLLSQI